MAQETQQATVQLAKYATVLRYGERPDPVVQRAKVAIADTVAAIAFGAGLPWGRIVLDRAGRLDWPKVEAAVRRPSARHRVAMT